MNAFRIESDMFAINQLLAFEISKQVNEHVCATISAIINEEEADRLLREHTHNKDVKITCHETGRDSVLLFHGLVRQLDIEVDGMLNKIHLTAVSFTSLLDQQQHFRSFQNKNQTYFELIKEVIQPYKMVLFHCKDKVNKIDSMQIQYKETDWQFLKRMASQSEMVLAADCKSDKAAFYFGICQYKNNMQFLSHTNKVCESMHMNNIYRSYKVEGYEPAEVGEEVLYQNQKLYIHSMKICLIQDELRYFYHLKTKEHMKIKPYENDKIVGVSLQAQIVNVDHNKLRIEIKDDEGMQVRKKWFEYATVYASADTSGWYCMPEEGDAVCLYFPDMNPDKAYVMNSVEHSKSDNRYNPEHKYFRTKYDKEIRFSPDKIKITNHKGMSITLDDKTGIEIRSNKNITLTARQAIDLRSEGCVEVSGNSAVVLKQHNNMIAVRDGIREMGHRIERQ